MRAEREIREKTQICVPKHMKNNGACGISMTCAEWKVQSAMENMMHWRAFLVNSEKSKRGFWTTEHMKRDIWDCATHILHNRVIFEENRVFLVETDNSWSISDPKR